jgi:hypothetical protein
MHSKNKKKKGIQIKQKLCSDGFNWYYNIALLSNLTSLPTITGVPDSNSFF